MMIPRKRLREMAAFGCCALTVSCIQALSGVEPNSIRSRDAPAPVANDLTGILLGVHRTVEASARSASVWPGFDPRAQVLLVVVGPEGPVYLIGDPAPPPEYRWTDEQRRIAFREGTPPDSLLGLRLHMDWNGRSGVASAVTFTPAQGEFVPHVLLHEAFHTYQHKSRARDSARFLALRNPAFPHTSVEALALLNLEGAHLDRALRTTDRTTAQAFARTALAVRAHRCDVVGAMECAQERSIELREGTASYVAAAMLGEALGYGGPALWRDSLAQSLSPVRDLRRLERWYFYDSGHAWLLLLDQFGPGDWKQHVETNFPDQMLAEVLRVQRSSIEALVKAAQQSTLWRDAQASAREAVHQELVRRDSVERAFWDRPGVPVRVYFGRVTRHSSMQDQLPDGRIERTLTFDSNQVILRGPSQSICCPGAMTVAPVQGQSAEVNGRAIALDRPGQATGVIVLDLPEITIRLEMGELRVFPDSIVLRAQ